jgi:thioredoxin 1
LVSDVTPEEVEQAKKNAGIVLVDCWAPWCGPCKALGPILEELEEKYSDNSAVKFFKVNTDEHRQFALENSLTAIPCVLVYKDGELATYEDPHRGGKTDRLIGLRPAEQYQQVIDALLE